MRLLRRVLRTWADERGRLWSELACGHFVRVEHFTRDPELGALVARNAHCMTCAAAAARRAA